MEVKEQHKCQVSSKQASFVDSMFSVFSQGFLVNAIDKISKASAHRLKVTEIGCYNARLMNFLIQRKIEVDYIGVDIRRDYLCESELIDHERVSLFCADITDFMSVRNNSQDVVVCSEVFEHLDADDLPKAVKNMIDILKPGGTLITSFPMNTRAIEYHNVENERDLGHVNFPIHEDYIKLVESFKTHLVDFDSGFTIRSFYEIPVYIRDSIEYRRIQRTLGQRVAVAFAMATDKEHTGGGYYTFIKGE
jgi:SAM-dependent methyltransferase